MAMRAFLKKISPQSRCLLQRIHLYSVRTANNRGPIKRKDIGGDLNNEKELVSDLKKTKEEEMSGIHGVWKPKNEEEEQQSDLKSNFWVKSIHEVLYKNKKDKQKPRDHRLLLSMKILQPDGTYCYHGSGSLGGGIIQLTTASPHTGLIQSTKKILVDSGPYELPRQTVNGLVFITRHGAFLTYDPATGDMSPWIKTPTKMGSRVETIALGYSPKSNKHKVICISVTLEKSTRVIEVLTLGEGENTWRRIDAKIKVVNARLARTKGAKEEFVDGPFYVNGFIHWRFRIYGSIEDIMRFNVDTEEFDYFGLQKFAISPSFRLMEVDGRVAVLKRTSHCEASLWVVRVYKNNLVKWSEVKIKMPDAWTDPDFSIEALAGTNLIFIQQERHNCIFCYNRKTKKWHKFPISPNRGPLTWERIIQL